MSIFLDGLHWICSIYHVCIMKKKVAAWKPPALTGFLSVCRKDKNNTKMDDEDMDGPIYQPSGIIPTVIRPQESHGLCVIPQPV